MYVNFNFQRMSLAIVITTNEGNILAADSMETYRNAIGDVREGTGSRMKLFQLNKKSGAMACGLSFLNNKTIQQHIDHFRKIINLEELTISEIADKLYDYFFDEYSDYLEEIARKKKEYAESQGYKNVKIAIGMECITLSYKDKTGKDVEQKFYQPIMELLIIGFDPDNTNEVYKLTIPDPKEKNGLVLKLDKNQSGATWIGQTDILVRIIRGWSPELKRLKVISELPESKKSELFKQMDDQEYIINWATMTMQDAVDFATLAIKTTENIQKITDGTWQWPGSSPGVGGPIDIAAVTPEKGFFWIQKKQLQIADNRFNPDSVPNLK